MSSKIQALEALFEKFAQGQLELQAAQKHTDAQLLQLREAQKHTDAQLLQLREAQKHTDAQLAKTDRKLASLIEQFQGYQNNDAVIIERYFQKAFQSTMIFKDTKYDDIKFNLHGLKQNKELELDIVLINGSKVLIVEVKRKPHTKNLKQLLDQKESFPIVFDDFKNYTIELALAGQDFYEDLIADAKAYNISLAQPKNGGIEVVV